MIRNRRKFLFRLGLTILFMAAIFVQSGMPYRVQDTKPLLRKEFSLSADSLPKLRIPYGESVVSSARPYDFLDFLIRKLGHVTEYFLLTALWLWTLSQTALRTGVRCLLSVLLALAYAGTDEWHQLYVPQRTGHPVDVFVPDLAGMLLAVTVYGLRRMLLRLPKPRAKKA